ncbi:GNAT family N-acetyltransferase [Arenibaculum pallidiluteum]|uniref:GNAT family N-acetyltransferase n=1 Tax=Arenibaculum pallidiluteum TaxID=2812559 RepID=UPI001A95FE9E|nr:GNAT family N-acetyltransferase [Arenibaculum pallidiluteum]
MSPRPRVATSAEVEDLFAIRTSVIENHQSREELADLGITPESVAAMLAADCRAWICDLDGVPAAFSMAKAGERTVFAVFVRPEAEGRGLGRALLEAAESWLFAQGAAEIWLTTGLDPTLRAHRLYEAAGWRAGDVTADGQRLYTKARPAGA